MADTSGQLLEHRGANCSLEHQQPHVTAWLLAADAQRFCWLFPGVPKKSRFGPIKQEGGQTGNI